jgi:putative transposase
MICDSWVTDGASSIIECHHRMDGHLTAASDEILRRSARTSICQRFKRHQCDPRRRWPLLAPKAIHLARVYGERKRSFVGQHFWARGYYVSTVGRDEQAIREYIKNQEQEDMRLEQMNLCR